MLILNLSLVIRCIITDLIAIIRNEATKAQYKYIYVRYVRYLYLNDTLLKIFRRVYLRLYITVKIVRVCIAKEAIQPIEIAETFLTEWIFATILW